MSLREGDGLDAQDTSIYTNDLVIVTGRMGPWLGNPVSTFSPFLQVIIANEHDPCTVCVVDSNIIISSNQTHAATLEFAVRYKLQQVKDVPKAGLRLDRWYNIVNLNKDKIQMQNKYAKKEFDVDLLYGQGAIDFHNTQIDEVKHINPAVLEYSLKTWFWSNPVFYAEPESTMGRICYNPALDNFPIPEICSQISYDFKIPTKIRCSEPKRIFQ